MCGRAKLEGDLNEIKMVFGIPPDYPTPNFAPSWNVAPTDSLPIVRYDPKAGHRTLDLMRWGLIPYWAKDMKIGYSTINAQAETVDTKPAFKGAFQRGRRCLVLIEAFYEWKKLNAKEKQPYAIALADRGIMALAGLWETWCSPAEETVRSFTIITTTANELCGEHHHRMPVILPPERWSMWLGEEEAERDDGLKSLLVPYPSGGMMAWPVSQRVGNVKNNDASLIEPIARSTGITP
jgi:putative SOS response-associated peptidase YedK